MARLVKVMLDSGAFSAWTRGVEIELARYIAFIKENAALLDSYINLDSIPGERGRRPTVKEVDRAAAESLENYRAMRAAGLRPIPVFHFGESFVWLERLLEAGADYICLGGTVGTRTAPKRQFFDECFSILTNGRGEPIVRVHGLGVSEGKFVTRYPWYSVDSTSWAIAPIYGMILVPGLEKSRFSAQIYVADGKLDKRANSRRLEMLPPAAQDHVLKFAESCGVDIFDLRNDVYARTMTFIRTLQLMRPPARFAVRRGNFARGIVEGKSGRGVRNTDFRMVFATNLSHRQGWLLHRCGAVNRLLSYADLSRASANLQEYVEQGYVGSLKRWPDPDERAKVDWGSMTYHEDRRRRLVRRFEGAPEDGTEAAT